MLNFSAILLDKLKRFPDKQILHIQKTGQEDIHLNYRQLIEGSAHYSNALALNGVKPGDVVVIILQHGLDLIYSYFGTILNG